MSQESREALRRFGQKMRHEGSDGFADGPRPWEHWDESGHQANNRVWEGSARRVYPRRRKTRSVGYRLLSVLTYMALTTLLVGIGGVYYSHTQSQRLAQNGIDPLPVTRRPRTTIASAGDDTIITATAVQAHDLNRLSAPAAGAGSTQDQAPAAVETAPAIHAAIPVTDKSALSTATTETTTPAPETSPPATNGIIDSVAIETIVTEKSVTTTVYTRHPRQDEAEIVAAIETTPPPFAHEVVAAQPQVAGTLPPTVHITADEAMTAVPSTAPLPALQDVVPAVAVTDTIDTPDTASVDEDQHDAPPDNQAPEATDEAMIVALAEAGTETAVPGALAETAPETTAGQLEAVPDNTSEVQIEEATAVAATDVSSAIAVPEPRVETTPGVMQEQRDALPDNPTVATTAAGSATAVPEVTAEQPTDSVAAVTPVAKTGGWVINLASYTWKSTANRKLALFQQQGVDGEIFAVTINDKPMYRIRLTGFENSREAKAGIPAIEETLDLEGAWISRR